MLEALDHFTIRATDLDRTFVFYSELLGLRAGPRPPFSVPGHWLYAGAQPLLHVLQASASAAPAKIDHVALLARGRKAVEHRLAAARVPYTLRTLPDGSALQLFLQDPDGVPLELVFSSKEDR